MNEKPGQFQAKSSLLFDAFKPFIDSSDQD